MFWRNPSTRQDNMCRTNPAPYKEHLVANSQTPQAPLKGCLCGTLMIVCEDGNLPAPILMSCILCFHVCATPNNFHGTCALTQVQLTVEYLDKL